MPTAGGNGNWTNCSARNLNANNAVSNANRNYAGGLQRKEIYAVGIPRQKSEISRTILAYEEVRRDMMPIVGAELENSNGWIFKGTINTLQ